MTITLLVIGKSNVDFVIRGIEEYQKRLKRYIRFDIVTLPDVKNGASLSLQQLKEAEGVKFLSALEEYDSVVLLDENGKEFGSSGFSAFVEGKMITSVKRLCFVIGGAYGFSDQVRDRYKAKLSLSKMTFSHQMIRLLFVEQLYRAFTILNGVPYHHE